jgi:hypothetical protein
MTVHTTSGLLYWRSNRSGPLALIPRIGAGYGWTESTRSDSAETRMGAGTIFQAGLFLEWTPLWSLAVEFGFDFRYSMFPDPLSALHPRLRLGWKF